MRILDEEAFINDIGIFRVELDTFPDLFKEELFLDIFIMTCGLRNKKQVELSGWEFKEIGHSKFKINKLLGGIHEYFPVFLDKDGFCVLNTIISI